MIEHTRLDRLPGGRWKSVRSLELCEFDDRGCCSSFIKRKKYRRQLEIEPTIKIARARATYNRELCAHTHTHATVAQIELIAI